MMPINLATHPRTGMGGNQPPEPIADDTAKELRARLERDHASLLARARDMELGIGLLPKQIATAEDATKVQDFIAQVNKLAAKDDNTDHAETNLCAAHKKEKQPFLDHGRVVDDVLLHCAARLLELLSPVRTRLERYHADRQAAARRAQEEQRRKAAAEHQKAEAEAIRLRAAAALLAPTNRGAARVHLEQAVAAESQAEEAQKIIDAPSVRLISRSDLGTAGYTVEAWDYEVTNPMQIPRQYLKIDEVVVRAAIKAGARDIPGLIIFQADRLVVRT